MNQTVPSIKGRIGGFRAFTLIELLVVVAIIAVLIAMLLPALSSAREHAKQVVCGSGQNQISKAILAYAQDNTDMIPPFVYQGHSYTSLGFAVSTSALSLLIKAPIGQSTVGYLPNADVFMCPSDTERAPFRDPNTPGGWAAWPKGNAANTYGYISYFYWYVDPMGRRYFQPTDQPGQYDGWQRYSISKTKSMKEDANPSKACILFDQGYVPPLNFDWPMFHPGGWSVLYLDGHVKWQKYDDIVYKSESRGYGGSNIVIVFDQEG